MPGKEFIASKSSITSWSMSSMFAAGPGNPSSSRITHSPGHLLAPEHDYARREGRGVLVAAELEPAANKPDLVGLHHVVVPPARIRAGGQKHNYRAAKP